MEKTLSKESFPRWVRKLRDWKIYAPVKEEAFWVYRQVGAPEEMDLDFLTSVLAPKKIVFPQREVLLEFSQPPESEPSLKEIIPEEDPVIVFGVRPCDAKALTLTDKVFGGDFKDLYYWKRRSRVLLVGLACNSAPSPNCFCLSVGGGPFSTEGLDLLMTDMGDKYHIRSLTEKGKRILDMAQEWTREVKSREKEEIRKLRRESEESIQRHIQDLEHIPPKLKGMFESSLWEEEAMSCLRCGICTYLCPTCHCFDINDEVDSIAPLKGKRVRTWDTCQFPDFTMHSSGHNPRPDKASRLRQRIMHKFRYFVEWFNDFQCTGCGRCITHCPVGIDIIEVLDKVRTHG